MIWEKLTLPEEVYTILNSAPNVKMYNQISELVDDACGGKKSDFFEVSYNTPRKEQIIEAEVSRVRNGVSVNYPEPYMRRRDPDSMVIADNRPTDKPKYKERFGTDFSQVREETTEWLSKEKLAVLAFHAGQKDMGVHALAIVPQNAAFFALGLALLQGMIPEKDLPEKFTPHSFIFVAPPFRHTHFGGKQVVVHNRGNGFHEMFAYNLYPGPSAKKGVYGILIDQGEQEGWVTAHCSAVQVVTPYDNVLTIMHEGASGGGKSEMLEQAHREADGRLLLGENTISTERRYLEIPRSCELHPVVDDMALCHPLNPNR